MLPSFVNMFASVMPKSSFIRNVGVLMVGTILSQIVTLIAFPILARWYSPEEFGLFSLLTNAALFFGVFATLRYELAIVVAPDDETAIRVYRLTLAIAILYSIVVLLVTILLPKSIAMIAGDSRLEPFLWSISIAIFLQSLNLAASNWLTRVSEFSRQSVSKLSQTVSMTMGQSVWPFCCAATTGGLMVGDLLGRMVGVMILLSKTERFRSQKMSRQQYLETAKKFSKFPLYVVPYGLANSWGQRVQLVLLANYGSMGIVGVYALSQRLVYMPISFVTASFKQAFFAKSAKEVHTPEFQVFLIKTLNMLFFPSCPVFVFAAFDMHMVIDFLFPSPEWKLLGQLAFWSIFPAMAMILVSWLDRVYDVLHQQRLALTLELVYSAAMTLVFWLTLVATDPVTAIATLCVGTAIYNVIWLTITLEIVGVPVAVVLRMLGLWLLVASAAISIHLILRQSFAPEYAAAAFGLCLALYFFALVLVVRSKQQYVLKNSK
jgi:O-antigen/teichoic acid export membrane protein